MFAPAHSETACNRVTCSALADSLSIAFLRTGLRKEASFRVGLACLANVEWDPERSYARRSFEAEAGASVTETDDLGNTPLLRAALNGSHPYHAPCRKCCLFNSSILTQPVAFLHFTHPRDIYRPLNGFCQWREDQVF
jgi:ankyrin repeat protein